MGRAATGRAEARGRGAEGGVSGGVGGARRRGFDDVDGFGYRRGPGGGRGVGHKDDRASLPDVKQ